jgi:hypothetical protein
MMVVLRESRVVLAAEVEAPAVRIVVSKAAAGSTMAGVPLATFALKHDTAVSTGANTQGRGW